MAHSGSQSWDLGRFLKTMAFFNVIPLLSRMNPLQTSEPARASSTSDAEISFQPSVVVVGDLAAPMSRGLVQELRTEMIPVRSYPWPQMSPDGAQAISSPDPVPSSAQSLSPWETILVNAALVIVCWDAGQPLSTLGGAVVGTASQEQVLFDYRSPQAALSERWGALDDVVMGGVSASRFDWADGAAVFRGRVSTANSGGFASVRTRNADPAYDLGAWHGIALRLKGDGQRYKLILRQDSGWDSVAYCQSFDTLAGHWQTVHLPFAAMVPTFRAKRVSGAPPLDPSRIRSMQLMLSKFEYDGALNPTFTPGDFELQVKTIGVYRPVPVPPVWVLTPTAPGQAKELEDDKMRLITAVTPPWSASDAGDALSEQQKDWLPRVDALCRQVVRSISAD
ncbi:uncharacterized protein XM38_000140 [Halomicronema hongdechloris C2206]|uniref:NADH:ubiquinone oxidoreductase intermediate-associated protein 30 domain-containing protein n=1 Tax=Halomicronema hongdechloris C2206 TaxID=1641165 RepID=A0A1Z3HFN8_9CYAN|nr:CIA30 family protein [Halomicronema hongdechloris]ASC69088.1 uncharacterized protein XM38_000140 [Halomicronema hongdechloris C2206]